MNIKVTKTYGKAALEIIIEGKDTKDALFKAAIFTEEDVCDACGSKEISLNSRKAQQYLYVSRHCNKCQAQSTLGTYEGGEGYFWKKFEKYQGAQNTAVLNQGVGQFKTPATGIPEINDLPF